MFRVKKVFGKIIALLIAAAMLLMFFPNACCLASSSQTWYDNNEYNFVDIYRFDIWLDDLESPEILAMYLETYYSFYNSDLSGSGNGIQLNLDVDSNYYTGWQRGGLGADYIVDITYDYGGLVGSLYRVYGEYDIVWIDDVFVSHDYGYDYMYFSLPWYDIDYATSFRWNLCLASDDGVYWYEDYVPADYGYETWQYYSSTPSANAAFYIGSSTYYYEGYYYCMDAAPYIKNGRTYVPVRYLAYSLGIGEGGIGWDPIAEVVTLTDGYTTVELLIGSKIRYIDYYYYDWMDVAPEIKNGRTMLPARWVAEAFGATVGWDSVNRMVTITY